MQLLVRLLLVQGGHQAIAFDIARDTAVGPVLHDGHPDLDDPIFLGERAE